MGQSLFRWLLGHCQPLFCGYTDPHPECQSVSGTSWVSDLLFVLGHHQDRLRAQAHMHARKWFVSVSVASIHHVYQWRIIYNYFCHLCQHAVTLETFHIIYKLPAQKDLRSLLFQLLTSIFPPAQSSIFQKWSQSSTQML